MEKLKFENFKPLTNNELNKIYGGKRVKTEYPNGQKDVAVYRSGELKWIKIYE